MYVSILLVVLADVLTIQLLPISWVHPVSDVHPYHLVSPARLDIVSEG